MSLPPVPREQPFLLQGFNAPTMPWQLWFEKVATSESTHNNVYYVSNLIEFNTAIVSGGTNDSTIILVGEIVLTDDLSIASNFQVECLKAGFFSGVFTLTFNGSFSAGLTLCFSGCLVVFADSTIKSAYPQWWGAKGDNSTDDHTAIQAAIGVCEVALLDLVFTDGTYLISDELLLTTNSGFRMLGTPYRSVIKAYSVMTAMVRYSNATRAEHFFMRGLYFNGNSLADHAIYGETLRFSNFNEITIVFTLVEAIYFEQGWINTFENCVLLFNHHGISGNGNANICNIINCVIATGTGTAIVMSTGVGLRINGCTIESNTGGGIYLVAFSAIDITGNYFERNGDIGNAITSPEIFSLKSNICINGSSINAGTLAAGTLCKGVKINANIFSNSDSTPVFACAVRGLELRDNFIEENGRLIETYGTSTYCKLEELQIANNVNTNDTLDSNTDIISIIAGGTDVTKSLNLHTVSYVDYEEVTNYFPENISNVADLDAGGGTLVNTSGSFRGGDVWEVADNGSNGATWGYTFDIDNDYPELLGKMIYFGIWEKWTSASSDTSLAIYSSSLGGYSYTVGTAAPSDWRFRSIVIPIAASGETAFKIGFRKTGTSSVTISVSQPIMTLVGNHFRGFKVSQQIDQLLKTKRVTTTYTILITDKTIFCDTGSGGFTVTLPAGVNGQRFRIINCGTSANTLTIAPNGSELLIGVNANTTLYDGESLGIVYETTEGWY